MTGLLWFIVVLLVIAWFLGFAVNVGWWINILLVLALLGIAYQLLVRPMLLANANRRDTVVHEDRVVHHRDDVDDEL